MDGDPPKRTIGIVEAALDPIAPSLVVLHLLLWAPYPVLGATVGGRSRRGPGRRGFGAVSPGSGAIETQP